MIDLEPALLAAFALIGMLVMVGGFVWVMGRQA